LWIDGLSARLFGVNPWSVLVPQAVIGVATVALVYATVRRCVAEPTLATIAGLLAGTIMALTPAAVLIFRFNNPDALLVLLMTAGAYCVVRASDNASWRWLALAGVALGFAFLTKMLAGLLVLPAFALAYLLFAPTAVRNRLGHLLIAGAALIASAGWWVIIVELWPTSARPYISNSTDNSVLNLALGYNGMSRIVGRGTSMHAGGFVHRTGISRLLTAEDGYEISWLLPAAALLTVAGCYLWYRKALQRNEKTGLVLWSGWLAVCTVMFAYMDGMTHAYYTVAMAPPIAAIVALGVVWAWRRGGAEPTVILGLAVTTAAGWSAWLLHTGELAGPWLPWTLAVLAVAAIIALIISPRVAIALGVIASLGGLTGYGVATAATPHQGSNPSATRATTFLSPGQQGLENNPALAALLRATSTRWSAATDGSQGAAALELASGTSVMAIGGWRKDPVPSLPDFIDDVRAGQIGYYIQGGRRDAAPTGKEISSWVARHYAPTKIGPVTVYRLY